MEELKKINRIIEREYPEAYRENLIVLDGTTGQNALVQAKQFKETADITGIVLTKLDGTAKGGIAIAIQAELGVPVKYIGIGEKIARNSTRTPLLTLSSHRQKKIKLKTGVQSISCTPF